MPGLLIHVSLQYIAFTLNADDGEAFIRALYDTRWPAFVLVRATISVWFMCGCYQGLFEQYPVVSVSAWFVDLCKLSIDCFCA